MTVEALRSSIHGETHIDPAAQHLYHNGRLISDNNKTMEELSIGDGEMLALHVRDMRGSTGVPTNNSSSSGQAGSSTQNQQQPGAPRSAVQTDPEVIRLQFLGNPSLIPELRRTQPRLADHINDPQQFAAEFRNAADREFRDKAERQRQIAALNADPFDVEAQAKIEEMIRQERVMENLQNAMEHNPEGEDKLLIQGVEVPFLGEADIPKEVEEALAVEPKLAGPSGMAIGAKSGTVSQPAQPAQQAQQTEQAQPSFPNEAIEQLVQLGFSREAVINALHATGGNVEYAAGLLFDQ
ncbi:hypothetical protein M406DRAFT_275307 [Cryphonectria parasitica EP155]|uniref:DNA damage-inducible protein 1 n=1 Tax=Cryphonectria parasitica (strain ATCC 38755 / EP155) TaxID=660469 RepID=A0A9P4Y7A7_CRYP1|nr:uncharacterized protein M406DRAFT_275307 [Cryphonectria parasitica EP155]KAF3767682.1 hypothetical protein M406DRAFT_275307 [Cryphonectria parasitica EP155]